MERGRLPASITVDNGSEFCSRALEAWVMAMTYSYVLFGPGRPVENGFIESFNGRLRDECLNVEWFVFAGRCTAEAGEVSCALQSRAAAQLTGGSNAGGIRGAAQAR